MTSTEAGCIPEGASITEPTLSLASSRAMQVHFFTRGGKSAVTLHEDGRVEIAEGIDVDEAAKVFWDAVRRYAGSQWK